MKCDLKNILRKGKSKNNAYCASPRSRVSLKLRFMSHVKQDVVHGVHLLRCHVQELAHSLTASKNTVLYDTGYTPAVQKRADLAAQRPNSRGIGADTRMRSELNACTRGILDASRGQHADVQQKVFTTLRSPFVFKKTREQFAIKTHVCDLVLTQDLTYAPFLLQRLAGLTLPCELQVTVLGS